MKTLKNLINASKGVFGRKLSGTELEEFKGILALELQISSHSSIAVNGRQNEQQSNKFNLELYGAGDVILKGLETYSPTYKICAKAIDMLDADQSLNKEMLIGDFVKGYLAEHKTEIDELCVGQNIAHDEL